MNEKRAAIIREFLTKDNENYNLTLLGFIRNVEDETRFLQQLDNDTSTTSFPEWKRQLMTRYYEKRQFSTFVQSHLNHPLFISTIHEKALNMVETKYMNELEHAKKNEVDTFLNPDKETLAYLLPYDIFQNYYQRYFTPDIVFANPEELYRYCQEVMNELYPLPCQEILEFVKNATPSICDKISRWLKQMIDKESPDRDDLHHEIYLILINAIQKHRFHDPNAPRSVRNYILSIIKYKRIKAFSQRRKLVYTNEMEDFPQTEDSQAIKDQLMKNEKILNLLQNPTHPLRKELFKGMEDKIDTLLLHFLEGLSYEEIAIRKYGQLSPENLRKAINKFRQDICRIKVPLRLRIEQIIPKL